MADDVELEWVAPGPGSWMRDPTHFTRPVTPLSASFGFVLGKPMATGFARVGIASSGADTAMVHGWPYQRARPFDPTTFDGCDATARDFLENRRWDEWLEEWQRTGRPNMDAACRALAAVEPAQLDDEALVAHFQQGIDVAFEGSRWHFEQHALCVLIGLLLSATRQWGIPDEDVVALLDGASPASVATAESLQAIASALSAKGVRPESIEDIRAAAPAQLDAFLAEHAWRPIGAFDLDVRLLVELPDVVVESVLLAMDGLDRKPEPPDVAGVRERVPVEERDEFDRLLAGARSVYGLRDDDVAFSMTGRGRVRRAVLEVASRLVARGHIANPDDVFVLTKAELIGLLLDGKGPAASEVAARAAYRERSIAANPPLVLGDPPEPPPDLSALPPHTRRLTAAMAIYTAARRPKPPDDDRPLTGTGIGTTTYRGRAVVAGCADEALDRIEPGDVLVTSMTTPAFNGVLLLCGALVVEEAGLLSHAAVMARELGLPALMAVRGATTDIPDGATVEIDPVAGAIRLVSPARTGASR